MVARNYSVYRSENNVYASKLVEGDNIKKTHHLQLLKITACILTLNCVSRTIVTLKTYLLIVHICIYSLF